MKKIWGLVFAAVMVLSFATPLAKAQDAVPPQQTFNAAVVELKADVVSPESGGRVMWAFIETGSNSSKCMTSLNNARDPWLIRTVFCAPNYIGPNGKKGIQITVLFDAPGVCYQSCAEGTEAYISLTVSQERAKLYGPPVYWPY
jgi:hypothetical protein